MRKRVSLVTALIVTLTMTMAIVAPSAAAQSPWSPRSQTQSSQVSLCQGYIWCEGLNGSGIVVSAGADSSRGFAFLRIDTFAGWSNSENQWVAGGKVSLQGFPLGSFSSSSILADNIVSDCQTSCVYEVRGEGWLSGKYVNFMLTYSPDTRMLVFTTWDWGTWANEGTYQGRYMGNMNIHSPWQL